MQRTEGAKISSVEQVKHNYYAHLKALNPNIEGTFHGSKRYYSAEIAPLLPEDREARILDVGCGFGLLVRFLIEQGFPNTGGIELDRQLYAECQAHIGSAAAFLHNTTAQDFLKDHKGSFDVIVATDVIEHFTVEEALGLVSQIREALRPGGRIILRTPNMANIFGGYSRYMDLTHQTGFTEQSLAQLLCQCGFARPQLHLPDWSRHPLYRKFKWSTRIQRWLFKLQDRSEARCFDKNLIMWASKE